MAKPKYCSARTASPRAAASRPRATNSEAGRLLFVASAALTGSGCRPVAQPARNSAVATSSARQKLDPACDAWRRELGACEAGPGFGVKPRENEEGRGGAAAPRSGGESPAGLSANGTRRRVIEEIIGWGFRGRYCPIDGSGPFVCDKATRPGKISPSLGQS